MTLKTSLIAALTIVFSGCLSGTIFIESPHKGQRINVSQPCIGLIELNDTITGNKQFVASLYQLINNPLVHGILLTIDSAGGGVTDGFKIYEMVKLANKRKPIVVYVTDTCASGAYMIACGAATIVASPMAEIGSIGVALNMMKKEYKTFKVDGMSGDLKNITITRGKFKRVGQFPFEALNAEDEAHLNVSMDQIYDAFCKLVAEQRNLTIEQVKATEAAVYGAPTALEKGLIDQVGTIFDAMQALKIQMQKKGCILNGSVDLFESIIVPTPSLTPFVQ